MVPDCSALTFGNRFQVVRATTKRPNIFGQPDARLQLGIQQIAFVQEQYKLDVRQELIAAYRFPEKNTVFLSQEVNDHKVSQ